jgi:hypothetical protein
MTSARPGKAGIGRSKKVSKGSKGSKGRRSQGAKVKWGTVNWNLSDSEIARLRGCSRERVRQVRNALGVGRSPMWHRKSGSVYERIGKMKTENMTVRAVAARAGCSRSYAFQCLQRDEKPYIEEDLRSRCKYAWEDADWSMTDTAVAAALGVKNPAVVTQHRRRHGIMKRVVEAAPSGEGELVSVGVERE